MAALEQTEEQGGHVSGMQSVAFTSDSAVAAMFAATGQDLGMVGTSSMAHDVLDRTADGIHVGMRFAGLEVGTVGGGTGLPHARAFLSLLGCQAPGSPSRLSHLPPPAAPSLASP